MSDRRSPQARAGVHASSFAAQCGALCSAASSVPPLEADYFDTDALGLQMEGQHRDVLSARHSAHSWWIGVSGNARHQGRQESIASSRSCGTSVGCESQSPPYTLALDDPLVGLQELGDSDENDGWCENDEEYGQRDAHDYIEHDGPASLDCFDLSMATTVGASPQQEPCNSPLREDSFHCKAIMAFSPPDTPQKCSGRSFDRCHVRHDAGAGGRVQHFIAAISATRTEAPRVNVEGAWRGQVQQQESIDHIKNGLKMLKARSDAAAAATSWRCPDTQTPRKMESESDVAPGPLVRIPRHMRGKGVSTVRGDLHRM